MNPVFISKTARDLRRGIKEKNIDIGNLAHVDVPKSTHIRLVWIGEGYELKNIGSEFGFNIMSIDNSVLGVITIVSCVVISGIELCERTRTALNVACEYDIPTVWIGSEMPLRRPWSFDEFFTPDVEPLIFWRKICQLVK